MLGIFLQGTVNMFLLNRCYRKHVLWKKYFRKIPNKTFENISTVEPHEITVSEKKKSETGSKN